MGHEFKDLELLDALKFYGEGGHKDGLSAQDFLRTLEARRKAGAWDDKKTMGAIQTALYGKAAEWFTHAQTGRYMRFPDKLVLFKTNYAAFKKDFLEDFDVTSSTAPLQFKAGELRQKTSEDAPGYCHRLLAKSAILFQKLCVENEDVEPSEPLAQVIGQTNAKKEIFNRFNEALTRNHAAVTVGALMTQVLTNGLANERLRLKTMEIKESVTDFGELVQAVINHTRKEEAAKSNNKAKLEAIRRPRDSEEEEEEEEDEEENRKVALVRNQRGGQRQYKPRASADRKQDGGSAKNSKSLRAIYEEEERRRRENGTCNFCKKTGHLEERCWAKRRLQKRFPNGDRQKNSVSTVSAAGNE